MGNTKFWKNNMATLLNSIIIFLSGIAYIVGPPNIKISRILKKFPLSKLPFLDVESSYYF